ncbi:chemotaxis protein [Shewanella avicenniae]|uniref:Chemotaxis protein n=1 Tax=Shewanella avicenniae TaxID=2814294 RepID=A0ABX7QW58_9GAMM|nr:chemotaxis protein [Shewanella avicenniae]QSX35257.1 chemotaxis protein [Shewanella avicenniae]
MQIQSAFYAGVQGLQSAQNGLTQATVDVARPTENEQSETATLQATEAAQSTDKTGALVSAMASQQQGEAAVNVIDRANETVGSIIDIEV